MSDYLKEEIQTYEKALQTFSEVFIENPSQLEMDGAIKRFEYCFELSWKTLKLALNKRGISEKVNSPKSCFQRGFLDGFIVDEEAWVKMLLDRNLSTHTYNRQIAEGLYKNLRGHYESMLKLLEEIKKEV